MKARMLCLLALLAPALPAAAQDPARRAQIQELMQVTGASRLGIQYANAVSQNMAAMLKRNRPDIPERAFGVLHQELVAVFQEHIDAPGGLMDRIVPIYEKHFSAAEIADLLAFYRTPTGRKAIAAMPAVLQESMAAGQEWGRGMGPEIQRRVEAALKREGIDMPKK